MLDNFFWAAALGGELGLIVVLISKGRWRDYPAFTGLVGLPVAASLILVPLQRLGMWAWYEYVYYPYLLVNFVLQLAVVVELARAVLRPTGTWVQDARKQFMLTAFLGIAVALALAYLVAPSSHTKIGGLVVRANLFTSLLICELFIAVSLASNRLGLGWRNHVMAIGQGFTAWSLVAAAVDSVHSYLGAWVLYDKTESIQSGAYVLVLGYWCMRLWREEPVRQPISAELRKFILALHERVQYDLGEAER